MHPKKTGLSDPQGSQIHAVQEMQIRVGTLRSSYVTTPRPLNRESNLSGTSRRQPRVTLSNQTPPKSCPFLYRAEMRGTKNQMSESGIRRNLLLLGDLLLELARLLPQRLHPLAALLSLSLPPGHTRARTSRKPPWRRRYATQRRTAAQAPTKHAARSKTITDGQPAIVRRPLPAHESPARAND